MAQPSNTIPTLLSGWPSGALPLMVFSANGTLTYTSIAAVTGQEQTIAVPGAVVGNAVFASPASTLGNTALVWCAWVSAAGVVSVRVVNPTAGAITPAAVAWSVMVLQ